MLHHLMQLQGVNYNALPMPMIQHQDCTCQSEASATAEQVCLRTFVLAASQGIIKKFTVAEESAVQVESQCLDRNEPILAEQEQSASTAESEPESAPHDQMKLRDLTERIEICSNPSADRDMTLDEKSKLTACIASLNGFELEQVLEIVMREEPDVAGMFCSPCSLIFIHLSGFHSFFGSVVHPSMLTSIYSSTSLIHYTSSPRIRYT